MTTATAHPSPTNPNHPPVPTGPEQNTGDDPFEFLDVDALQDLRDAQNDLIERESHGLHPLDTVGQKLARQRAMDKFDDLRHEYLQDRMHIDENDPDYVDCFDYVAQVSVDNMSDHDWYVGEYDDQGNKVNPSGRQMVEEFHDESLHNYNARKAPVVARGAAPVPTPPTPLTPPAPVTPPMPSPNSDPTIVSADMLRELHDRLETGKELVTNLHEARDRLAQMALDHQGRLLGGRTSEEYKKAHDEYNQAVIAYGKFREQQIDPHNSRTEDERNASAVGYLLKEAAELRTLTNEKWENTKVGKICKWMAKGNWFQRTVKGVAIGAAVSGGVAIVTAATAGTGTVGIIAGGAGTVATLASRMMRGYGAVRGRSGGMAENLNPAEIAELQNLVVNNANIDAAALFSSEKYFNSVENERGKNRKAAAWSLGAVAMGAGGAEVAHLAVEHSAHYVEHLSHAWDRVRSAFGYKPDNTPNGSHVINNPNGKAGAGTGSGVGPNGLSQPNGGNVLIPSNPNAQHLFTPESFHNGVNVPLHHGDGIYRLADRYGLSNGQRDKLMHVLSQRHDGSTYWQNGDLRLNYNHGGLKLSPKELGEIFSNH